VPHGIKRFGDIEEGNRKVGHFSESRVDGTLETEQIIGGTEASPEAGLRRVDEVAFGQKPE
jgi:hypothetical protein